MTQDRKITVLIPENLLNQAQKSTGEGITATVRRGLKLLAAQGAYAKIRGLRGEVRFSLNLEAIREDR